MEVTKDYKNPLEIDLIARKPYSAHPDDNHLEIVLCEIRGHMPYVTWARNHETRGDNSGHYHSSLIEAMRDFNTRGAF